VACEAEQMSSRAGKKKKEKRCFMSVGFKLKGVIGRLGLPAKNIGLSC
jgi:hypothetical protein